MPSIVDGIKEIYPKLSKFKYYLVKHPATAELKRYLNKIFKYYFFIIMYLFVVVAILNIFTLILSPPTPDFKDSINIGERGALFLAVITGLVFTYADALDSPKKNNIIKSGEAFFKSFPLFVIGMIFSIGLSKSLMNPTIVFCLIS